MTRRRLCWRTGMTAVAILAAMPIASVAAEPVRDVGSRRQLFVDDWLIGRMTGLELKLHHPTPREVAIVFDQPWEGNVSAYVTVFRDGNRFRMYYRGAHYDYRTKKTTHQVTCYAESRDGIRWTKPKLGLVAFKGSKANNIVWDGVGSHNFTPFLDTNPECRPERKYKALATGKGGLLAFSSADGLRWQLLQPEPVITKGAFDSQNLAFWDSVRGRYVDFHRGFRNGVRDILTCTSRDFVHWTEPEWLDYGDAPREHLYTNAVVPYFRAPHVYLGFPKRFVPHRRSLNDASVSGVSDGVFMTSRDGRHWRRWTEAFIRPGPQPDRWRNRNNMTAWGLIVTRSSLPGAPDEISLYSSENYYAPDGPGRLRRYTIRLDGFVSVHAGGKTGEFVTHPLRFDGDRLRINFSTSAAGMVRVEIQNQAGEAIPGYRLAECPEIFGDAIDKTVSWKKGHDLSALAGRVIRLRFVMHDADLYALQFTGD